MGLKLREIWTDPSFLETIRKKPAEDAPMDSGGDQSALSPDDIFAQTLEKLQADGYKAGASTCEDDAMAEYARCLKDHPDDMKGCEAQLFDKLKKCRETMPPDPSGLTAGVLYVSANGGKSSAASPLDPALEYDFCVRVANKAKARSGPYRVKFELKGPETGTWILHEDEGSLPWESPLAKFHYGAFSKPGTFQLSACVFVQSDPNTMISCANSITFEVKQPQKQGASFAPASAGAQLMSAATPQNTGSNQAPQTDNSGLYCNDTVHVSKDGNVDEGGDLVAGVEYVFFAIFGNKGKHPSGPCFVRFTLSEDMDWQADFDLNDGLAAGDTVKALVNFGKFPNKWASYHLSACIYAKDAPEKPIACAGEYEMVVTET